MKEAPDLTPEQNHAVALMLPMSPKMACLMRLLFKIRNENPANYDDLYRQITEFVAYTPKGADDKPPISTKLRALFDEVEDNTTGEEMNRRSLFLRAAPLVAGEIGLGLATEAINTYENTARHKCMPIIEKLLLDTRDVLQNAPNIPPKVAKQVDDITSKIADKFAPKWNIPLVRRNHPTAATIPEVAKVGMWAHFSAEFFSNYLKHSAERRINTPADVEVKRIWNSATALMQILTTSETDLKELDKIEFGDENSDNFSVFIYDILFTLIEEGKIDIDEARQELLKAYEKAQAASPADFNDTFTKELRATSAGKEIDKAIQTKKYNSQLFVHMIAAGTQAVFEVTSIFLHYNQAYRDVLHRLEKDIQDNKQAIDGICANNNIAPAQMDMVWDNALLEVDKELSKTVPNAVVFGHISKALQYAITGGLMQEYMPQLLHRVLKYAIMRSDSEEVMRTLTLAQLPPPSDVAKQISHTNNWRECLQKELKPNLNQDGPTP